MNLSRFAASAATLLLATVLANSSHAAVVTLHADDFAYIATGNSTGTGGSNSGFNGAGVYVVTNAYQAEGAVRLGKSDAAGAITTTNLSMQAGTLSVRVDVKGWTTDEADLTLSVAGREQTFDYSALMASATFETIQASFEIATAGSYPVEFRSSPKRTFIDNIHIYQEFLESGDPEFVVTLQSASAVNELAPVRFMIEATVGGSPTNVACASALPSGASYGVTNLVGYFSWTPALGQAGVYPLDFTAPGGDGLTYTNTVAITVNALPLTAPVNLAASNIGPDAFDLSWDAVPAATQGYVVSVWHGSGGTNTPATDAEPFYNVAFSGMVSAPPGWTFSEVNSKYSTAAFIELKLDDAGDFVATKLYPKPVTQLDFRIKWYPGTAGTTNQLVVSASADGVNWTPLRTYSTGADFDGDDTNNIFTKDAEDVNKRLTFAAESGYRAFKFGYTQKVTGNMGLANFAVVYEGCGTKFVGDWDGKATTSLSAADSGARPGRDHCALVGARNATETKYALVGVTTLEAPTTTVIVVR